MSARNKTALVMGVLVLASLVWEVYALSTGETAGGAWTISRLVWDLSGNPLFTFAFGMLIGHFFFPKSVCLHCGFKPYRRDAESSARFDAALKTFAISWHDGRVRADDAKHEAGFPVWREW